MVTTSREANYLRTLGQRIAKASKRPGITYRLQYIKSDGADRMALPGGYIFVSEGFLRSSLKMKPSWPSQPRDSACGASAFDRMDKRLQRLYADDEVVMSAP